MRGHHLTIAGLAHTTFPQRTSCRSHVVIATAKLRASTLTGLTFMGLGLVDLGVLKKKPEVGKSGINLVVSGVLGLTRGRVTGKVKGHNHESELEKPTQAWGKSETTSEARVFERMA